MQKKNYGTENHEVVLTSMIWKDEPKGVNVVVRVDPTKSEKRIDWNRVEWNRVE